MKQISPTWASRSGEKIHTCAKRIMDFFFHNKPSSSLATNGTFVCIPFLTQFNSFQKSIWMGFLPPQLLILDACIQDHTINDYPNTILTPDYFSVPFSLLSDKTLLLTEACLFSSFTDMSEISILISSWFMPLLLLKSQEFLEKHAFV